VSFCGNCGTGLQAGVRFCGECGTPVTGRETQLTSGDPTTAPMPPVQRPAENGLLARLTPEALLAGDWLGAGRVALAALSTMIAITFAAELLSKAYDLGAEALIVSTLTLTAGALGGDTVYSIDGPVSHIGFTPLTVTVGGAVVLVAGLCRWLDRHPATELVDCCVQAGRVVVVFSLLGLVVSLVGRGKIPLEDVSSERYSVHATVAGTFFGALLLAVCAAVLAFALRPAILPTKVRRIRDRAAGSAQALAIAGLVAMALTAVGGTVLILVALDTDKLRAFAALFIALPNAMIYALLTGMGVTSRVTGASDSLDPLGIFLGHVGGTSDDLVSLIDVTGVSPWFWLLTAGAVVVWAIAALLAVLREDDQHAARRSGVWFLGMSVLVVVIGVWLTTTSSATEADAAFHGSLGPSAGGAFLLTFVWAAVAAFLAVGLAPQLRPSLGPLARRIGALSPARSTPTPGRERPEATDQPPGDGL
jgi:hypothetical protein